MVDMIKAKYWGEAVKELVIEQQKKKQAVQHITYGGKTVACKKGKIINFTDFLK